MHTYFKKIEINDDYVIVDKKSGISSHPSPGDTAPDIVSLLSSEGIKAAPVTRLDSQASGLVLMSGSADFINNVDEVMKKYTAIVIGIPPETGKIDRPLISKKFNSHEKREQEALTEYDIVKSFGLIASTLSVTIQTGRHHQIRKHLRSIGHPVIGDFRHGFKDRNLELQGKWGNRLRLFLHCSELTFNWNGDHYQFSSQLPEDMKRFISFLELA